MYKLALSALLAIPVAVIGGLVYAKSLVQPKPSPHQIQASSYTCPLTGEELPCPNCCPLNQHK
jgi:hypothetical protein